MTYLAIRITILVLTILVALGIGLYLRRLLVRRLKKTVLDNWLIQLLGVLVIIIPPVILGVLIAFLLFGQGLSDISNRIQSVFHIPIQTFTWNLVGSILILLLAIGVGKTLVKLVTGGIAKSRLEINTRLLLGRIFYAVTIIIAFIWIFSLWNISITLPATVISIVTVGITFVFQDILRNLAAGLYILVEGPFQIGDQITVANYTGKVENVELRATVLRLLNGEQVIIPNSEIFSGVVVNNSSYEERRVTIAITMPQEEFDKDQTSECILKTIKGMDSILAKPEPALSLSGMSGTFGGSTGAQSGYTSKVVTLTLHFWVPKGAWSTVMEAMLALRTALPNADLALREPVDL